MQGVLAPCSYTHAILPPLYSQRERDLNRKRENLRKHKHCSSTWVLYVYNTQHTWLCMFTWMFVLFFAVGFKEKKMAFQVIFAHFCLWGLIGKLFLFFLNHKSWRFVFKTLLHGNVRQWNLYVFLKNSSLYLYNVREKKC